MSASIGVSVSRYLTAVVLARLLPRCPPCERRTGDARSTGDSRNRSGDPIPPQNLQLSVVLTQGSLNSVDIVLIYSRFLGSADTCCLVLSLLQKTVTCTSRAVVHCVLQVITHGPFWSGWASQARTTVQKYPRAISCLKVRNAAAITEGVS